MRVYLVFRLIVIWTCCSISTVLIRYRYCTCIIVWLFVDILMAVSTTPRLVCVVGVVTSRKPNIELYY